MSTGGAVWNLDGVQPIRGWDKDRIRRELPLEWVMHRFGFPLQQDTSGARLEGVCPFHISSPGVRKFSVYVTEDGTQLCGCWVCGFGSGRDVFDLVRGLTGIAADAPFHAVLQNAGVLHGEWQTDTAWQTRPAVVLQAAPKTDPAVFTAQAAAALDLAYRDESSLQRLIEYKRFKDPGWAVISPEYLRSQWAVGVEPPQQITRAVTNPDNSQYSTYVQHIPGNVVIPHFERAGQLVPGLKTRSPDGGALHTRYGSDLKQELYGTWRRKDHDVVLITEGEGDAWCAAAVLDSEMDVYGLPSGSGSKPGPGGILRPEWTPLFDGKTVILGFDADDTGRTLTSEWIAALTPVAREIRVVALPEGDDLASCPDLKAAVLAASGPGSLDEAAGEESSDPLSPSGGWTDDIANAHLFAEQHHHHLRWVPERKQWIVYTGTHWAVDHGGAAARFAMETARSLLAMAFEAYRVSSTTDAESLVERAKKSGERRRVIAMMELGRAYMEVREADLDTDGWVLNCLNGTLDLRTAALREHRPEDLLARVAPVHYDPSAWSPRWEKFLETTIPDPEERAFLQRFAGYSLTGEVSEEKFFVLLGDGGSGKSTFLEALARTMGPYSTTADPEMFLKSQRQRDPGSPDPAMVSLVGRRLVVSSEPPKGRTFDVGILKRITGGDSMKTRQLHGHSFEFSPVLKLAIMANLRIAADGDDAGGMARRYIEIPFPVVAGGGQRDDSLKRELLDVRTSGSAVLAWAVQGCTAWQEQGLAAPENVSEATADYWEEQIENDPVRSFLNDYFVTTGNQDDLVPRPKLHEMYVEVTRNRMNSRRFAAKMRELKYQERKSDGVFYWIGLRKINIARWGDLLSNAVPTQSTDSVTE